MYRKSLATLFLLLSTMILPVVTFAAPGELSGTINGLTCATIKKTCPIDKLDPHLATETGFVLMVNGGKHYLITDVSTTVLARHALEKAKITGEIDEKYGSIKADSLMVKKGDKYVEIWSKKAEQAERDKLEKK
jgi:hypothetical protein